MDTRKPSLEPGPDAAHPAPARHPFPWDDALALGLGALRWSPAAFWAATPREFAAALGRCAGPEPMTREAFERLLAAYPDPT
ncbi:rcc01693 family protein [Methylobacterium sp. A49B]